MTTFDLEITQVQLKNHTKSHESKLRISDPEWYGIYVQMSGPQRRRCRRPCVTRCRCHPHVTHCCCCRRTRVAVVTHASLAAAVIVAHTSLAAAVIVAHASPLSPSLSLPLAGPCWGVTIVVIVIVVVVVVVVSAATVAMWGDSVIT